MSHEKANKTLQLYYSALETYEKVQVLCDGKHINYPIVIKELKNCYEKIENIILGEEGNYTFLIDLFQLRQHAFTLITYIENDMKPSTKYNKIKTPYELDKQVHEDKEKQESLRTIEATIEVPRSNGLDEVAGLWQVKKLLKSLIILPKCQPQLFTNRNTSNSVLLFGPPGTGKTQIVHALAYEAKAILFAVSVGNILSPLVGQSEKNIKFLFDYIRERDTFSLLFIDEVDGFCRKRSSSEQEFSRRIKTELLCQLSKIEKNSNVVLIAATNCPWDLDAAFMRRFKKRVYIPLPDYSERRDLFRIFTHSTPLEKQTEEWEHLISDTEGFSGSDISDLVQQALNNPILELDDTKIWKNSPDGFYEPVLTTEDFNLEDIVCRELDDLPPCSVRAREVQPIDLINAFEKMNATVKQEDISKYEKFIKY